MAMVSMVDTMDTHMLDTMAFGDARREKLRLNLKPSLDTCMDMVMAMVSMVDTMDTHMLEPMAFGDVRREKLRLNLKPSPDTCMDMDMAMVFMVDIMATHMLAMAMEFGDARREKLKLLLNPDTCTEDMVTIGENNFLPSHLRSHQSAQFEPTMTFAFPSDLLFTCVQSYLIILYVLCIVQHNNA